jgi:Nickel responsive protein SCO4226-like
VTRYMVERSLPGFGEDQLPGAAGAAKSTSAQMTKEGTPVRYLRSTFVPQEEKCFCLFEGDSVEAIKTAQERAGLPYDRIVEARFITADEV